MNIRVLRFGLSGRFGLHLEWRALDDTEDERGEAKFVLRCGARDGSHRGHVLRPQTAARRVGQHAFGEYAGKHVRMTEQRPAKRRRPVEAGAVDHYATRVDRRLAIERPPLAGVVEVLE
jgi:hypothetical protein